ncbi:MAG: IS66 family insertion sequence element accessory protein TnpB [Myxococcaceae bacterium]|nr:IS66 family insertion sequence element accessory protein TnpB [Myxococcaceae bacterium]MCI0673786.1 IS66 family insertion sequence element accessory protein TnpB [Myxococcaceae bacterium]
MIPSGVDVFLAVEPIDLRWGFDRLAGLVQGHLERDARSGALYVFFGKRREAVKVLFFDGSGLCLFYKRLDRGVFRLPEAMGGGTCVQLEERALDALLDGIDVEAPVRRARKTPTH